MSLLKLAARNLVRHRRRSAISLVALVIGLAAPITVKGFFNGVHRTNLHMFSEAMGALQVHRKGYTASLQGLPLNLDFADTPELRGKIAAAPGVVAVVPRIVFGGMLAMPDAETGGREPTESEKGRTTYLVLTAFDPVAEREVSPRRKSWLSQGRLFEASDAPEVVLDDDLAGAVRSEAWPDPSKRPAPERWPALLAPDRDGVLNAENVAVAGTIAQGIPGDHRLGYVGLATAQRLLRMEGRVTGYALTVDDDTLGADDQTKLHATRDAIAAALGPEFEVKGWDEIVPFMLDEGENQRWVVGILGTILMAIALLGVVNTLLMSVLERVREIGTLMALGMKRRALVGLFLLEGLVLGFTGALAGGLVGAALVAWMGSKGVQLPAPGASIAVDIRPYVHAPFVVVVVALGILGAAAAALWPAYRASRLRPVEALAQ